MKVTDIIEALDAKVICGKHKLDLGVECAFASDLMSDVLRIDSENMILLTGLANLQAIRTCEMSDINVAVFVRGKKILPEMIDLAEENEMVLLECDYSMYRACGILFSKGITHVY